jgi:hypothetical protein
MSGKQQVTLETTGSTQKLINQAFSAPICTQLAFRSRRRPFSIEARVQQLAHKIAFRDLRKGRGHAFHLKYHYGVSHVENFPASIRDNRHLGDQR